MRTNVTVNDISISLKKSLVYVAEWPIFISNLYYICPGKNQWFYSRPEESYALEIPENEAEYLSLNYYTHLVKNYSFLPILF